MVIADELTTEQKLQLLADILDTSPKLAIARIMKHARELQEEDRKKQEELKCKINQSEVM